ncbi:MAG: agmatinase [Phycisphaerae bacterium]|nr:agmatinase [Phycisphaerae bacterium]
MSDIPDNFLGLPSELCDPATAKYAVLPVPYEGTVSYMPGTADGPAVILDASKQVEWFDEELLVEFHTAGIATYPAVPAADTPDEEMARIRAAAEPILRDGKFLLTLGGEHSITAPLVAAVAEIHGPISVLQFDAHGDLRDSYDGTKHSHAAVMRRVLETTQNIAQVGIRNFSKEEYDDCREYIDRMIMPKQINEDPNWMDAAMALLGEKVYITIDIDALDPSLAPGTGTPEPGGMTWEQMTGLLRRVFAQRQVVSADIVEVRPIPPNHATEFLAARLAYKLIAYCQHFGGEGKQT